MKFLSLIAAAAITLCLTANASAVAVNNVVFTLATPTAANGNANVLAIAVNATNVPILGSLSDNTETTMSGTFIANLTSSVLGDVSAFDIVAGAISASDFSFDLSGGFFGGATGDATNVGGVVLTDLDGDGVAPLTGPSLIDGNGQFFIGDNVILLNSGNLHIEGYGLAAGQVPTTDLDLSSAPISTSLDPTGLQLGNTTVTATGNPNEYTMIIEIPAAVSDLVVLGGAPGELTGTLGLAGTVLATATFSVSAVPEPTSGLFLASLAAGAGAVVGRRRKQ